MTRGKLTRNAGDPPFALNINLTSGQTFRWGHWNSGQFFYGKPDKNGYWCSTAGDTVICLREKKDYLEYIASKKEIKFWQKPPIPVEEFLIKLLRREGNIPPLKDVFAKVELTKSLLNKYSGLVVLRQDPYETLVSFMLSPMNRVERIAKTIDELAKAAGKRILFRGEQIYTIPTPEEILDADLSGVSFRYPNNQPRRLKEMAEFLINNPTIFDDCKKMSYLDAWKTLQKIPGVGPKIADCVLLYSLDFLEAVPVDVHIYRRTASMFPQLFRTKKKPTYLVMADMWRKVFHRYAGVVQLYVFIDARNSSITKNHG